MPDELPAPFGPNVAIDVDECLRHGGKPLITFLTFCIYSIRLEPLFVFLAGEFRLRPKVAGALALYDLFCAPQAPARIDAHLVLPPRELRLREAVERLRTAPSGPGEPEEPEVRRIVVAPARQLFDVIVAHLRERPLVEYGRDFDPELSATENLPNGRMNEAQRAFVDRVWQPRVRPQLVAAGFWKVANVG